MAEISDLNGKKMMSLISQGHQGNTGGGISAWIRWNTAYHVQLAPALNRAVFIMISYLLSLCAIYIYIYGVYCLHTLQLRLIIVLIRAAERNYLM